MQREEIKKILPHREPMLLLDSVELLEGGIAQGSLKIKGGEFFLQGHYPGNPVVPGVILCEIMAQSCCLLFESELAEGKTPYFTSLKNARFRRMVRPGETIITKAWITAEKAGFYFTQAEAYVDEKLCAKGEFSYTLMGDE